MKISFYYPVMILFCSSGTLWAQWATNGASIYNTNAGNVGIGTTSPQELLEVKGNNAVMTFHTPGIASYKIGNDGNTFKIAAMDNGYGGHVGNFANNNTQVIVMKTNGNVGIGTTSPQELLEVKGNNAVMTFHTPGIASYKIGNDGNTFKIAAMDNGYGGHVGNFANNNTQVIVMKTNGNVGIGTNSPSHKLSVLGVTSSDGIRIPGRYAFGQSESAIEIEVPSNEYNAIRAYNGTQHIGTIHFFDDTWGSGLPANSAGSINIDGTVAITIGGWNNPVAYFRKSDGNVGIGTATPSERFQVHTAGGTDNTFAIRSDENVGVELRSGSAHGTPYIDFSNDALDDYDMRLILSGDDNLSILGGNVGIGTISPDATLAVKGDIHTQEVRVDLNGAVAPDYVFEPGYELRSLPETEAYIKENKHLPEIPSAAEMEANGVELKAMNLKLLQKIEELTLHVIELNKKMEKLEGENRDLKILIKK